MMVVPIHSAAKSIALRGNWRNPKTRRVSFSLIWVSQLLVRMAEFRLKG